MSGTVPTPEAAAQIRWGRTHIEGRYGQQEADKENGE